MEKRTAITSPLWIKFCISAVVAALCTLAAVSISWGGMAPGTGKGTFFGTLFVLPLAVGVNFGWADAASVWFAFLAYFALSLVAVLALIREK
jgi:hypothetical protein